MRYAGREPTMEEVDAFYNDHSYFYGSAERGYDDYDAEEERQAVHIERRLDRLGPAAGGLLDVGCAAGFFLKAAESRGWAVSGIELAREMRVRASASIHGEVADDWDGLTTHAYGAVTMWDYIEHVPRPVDELERAWRALRPGGRIAISTPNAGHLQARRDLRSWREMKPPAHLTFFRPSELRSALEKAGFSGVEVSGYEPEDPGPPPAVTRLLGRIRARTGDRSNRRTPFWPAYSFLAHVTGLAWAALARRPLWRRPIMATGLEAFGVKEPEGAHP